MLRFVTIAGPCFAIGLIGAGAWLVHPTPETSFTVVVPAARKFAVLVSALSFAVAAVIDKQP